MIYFPHASFMKHLYMRSDTIQVPLNILSAIFIRVTSNYFSSHIH